MWYSSKSRNETTDKPSKCNSVGLYPSELKGGSIPMVGRNSNPNAKKFLVRNKSIAYCLLFALLLVTAGVTARQILIKNDTNKYEVFRMEKMIGATKANTLKTIAQDMSTDENLAKYSISLVLLHVDEWRTYWSSKNIRGFMSFYHDKFPDKKNFEDNKRRIFSKEQFIKIEISDVESEAKSDNIVVRFTQQYSSKSFSDTARKELIWKNTKDGWKIITETIIK